MTSLQLPQRISILHRPVKAGAQPAGGKETTESQYEREMQRLASKQQKQREAEDRMNRAFYPTTEDKQAQMHAFNHVSQEQSAAKLHAQRLQEEQDRRWQMPGPVAQRSAQPSDRPWANSALAYGSQAEEDAARKRYAAQTAEDNRHMQMQAVFERQRREEEEVSQARRMVQDEQSFWNRGATAAGERWVAPDLRRYVTQQDKSAAVAAAAEAGRVPYSKANDYMRRSVPVWAWDEAALTEQQRQRSEQARAAVQQQPQQQHYTPYANMADLERAHVEHKAQGMAYHAQKQMMEEQRQRQEEASRQRQQLPARPSTAAPSRSAPWATEYDLPQKAPSPWAPYTSQRAPQPSYQASSHAIGPQREHALPSRPSTAASSYSAAPQPAAYKPSFPWLPSN